MTDNIESMNELELYFFIDTCGAFMWRMNHDMCDGRIPEKDWPGIDRDIVDVRAQQMTAVRRLPEFGVASLDAENKPTPEYWVWFRTWDAWKKGLADADWRTVDAAVTRGLTADEVSSYKAMAFASQSAVALNKF